MAKRVFDYQTMAQKYNVKSDILAEFVNEARKEFDQDEMMIELHVIRAIRSLKSRGSL